MSKNAQYYKNYKAVLASKNVILLTTAGSEVLGMKSKDGDHDEIGIYLESPSDLFGFATQDTIVYRTATDRTGKTDAKSEPGDIDLTLYGMRKYLNLALGGNPNLINVLFTPESMCPIRTFLGAALQELAPKIVSKQAGKAFLGYLRAQRLRLAGSIGQKAVNRPELEAKLGFDTKYAMHMLRLGAQGKELLTSGKLTLPMGNDWTLYFTDIKNGRYSLKSCLDQAASQEANIEALLETSEIPNKPDYEAVEKWMIDAYLNAWDKKEVEAYKPS